MFKKVLVANRAAIACRILRTLRKMGVKSVAVFSEADRHSLHVAKADEAVAIGPSPAAQSYLKIDGILEAARQTGAEAIHPGYGFLSENAGFAEACDEAGIQFIGPAPERMRAFGLKHTARELAAGLEVPMLSGSALLPGLEHRDAFPHGKFSLRVEETSFSLRGYHEFLGTISASAEAFKTSEQAAFVAERERWAAAGQAELVEPPDLGVRPLAAEEAAPAGCEAVRSPVTASVWQINVSEGQPVQAGQRLLVLEAMKMEVAVVAPEAGVVEDLRCAPGGFVTAARETPVRPGLGARARA